MWLIMSVLTGAEQGAERCSSDYFHLELLVSASKKHPPLQDNRQEIKNFIASLWLQKKNLQKETFAIIISKPDHFIWQDSFAKSKCVA